MFKSLPTGQTSCQATPGSFKRWRTCKITTATSALPGKNTVASPMAGAETMANMANPVITPVLDALGLQHSTTKIGCGRGETFHKTGCCFSPPTCSSWFGWAPHCNSKSLSHKDLPLMGAFRGICASCLWRCSESVHVLQHLDRTGNLTNGVKDCDWP